MNYQFLTPCQATVTQADGSTVLMGYGIGEIIEVKDFSGREDPLYHPMSTMLTECLARNQDVPLKDGSYIKFHDNPHLKWGVTKAGMCGCGYVHDSNERCGAW